jgi:hypothetical protein
MNEDDERLQALIRDAILPTTAQVPSHDLWPALKRRIVEPRAIGPWWEWALGAAALTAMALSPSSILTLLYHL